ncbi:MAG: bifunctional [glutamine synthetase] adenylyltransferase/[glutamine synthetase]-adenylyl-L-tyrosine phosphorylase [Actinomycetes bacterium]
MDSIGYPDPPGISTAREASQAAILARIGFTDTGKAAKLLSSPRLAELANAPAVLDAFSIAADPDLALHSLERVVEASEANGYGSQIITSFVANEHFRQRLLLLLGVSEAVAEHLARHPDQWQVLAAADFDSVDLSRDQLRDELVAAVQASFAGGGGWDEAAVALRVAYRRRLLGLGARDLAGDMTFSAVTAFLADLADAVLAASLTIAYSQLPTDAAPCVFSIIALGKAGGRELNYISDVDVVFVCEPGVLADGQLANEEEALRSGTLLARGVMRAANESTSEGSIWEVDAALRPEGKSGALVRTLASHVGYYQRWAQTWEFQALLKARYAAGDAALGARYVDAVAPFVWSAADRPDFVADVQNMRARVEQHLPAKTADRELKLGKGGLRDVEFSVQMLQLVHGRSDVMLRSPNTLVALEAMSTWGYVGRDDAATLTAAYKFLRTMEHRLQLFRMRRTHVVPEDEASLRRLGRSMGFRGESSAELLAEWARHRRAVRRLHEKLFYRPLLNAVARLSQGEARLTREAARERLTALGYIDPDGALRHLEALTSGVSRRAAIQRTLLPVLLGWFADGPNPDAALLAFRRVSESLGGTPWYLRMLRDDSETAERMANILASSRYTTDLLIRSPDGVMLLSDPADLTPKSAPELAYEMAVPASRHEGAHAVEAIKNVRRRELLRISAADLGGYVDVQEVGYALSDLTDATLGAVLEVAVSAVERAVGGPLPTRFTAVGMGRVGGREAGYGSDADVMFVHDPRPDVSEQEATRVAIAVANELRHLLALPSFGPALELDVDLRPEGRAGPFVRSLASYARYYARWSSPWESQALLKARIIAGDRRLGEAFIELVNPVRWPEAGITDTDLREVRRIKARIESERLPRGADPALHVKLGRGGLVDIEWVAQLVQMRHAGSDPEPVEGAITQGLTLRSTNTLAVLSAATVRGYITEEDHQTLRDAWCLATRVRNAVVLVTGRSSDQVPTDESVRKGVAHVLGYRLGESAQLTEDYLRCARRARSAVERLFYGWD